MFHMYRAVVKDKGQIPYLALVTNLFRHLNVQPPRILCVRSCDQMVVGLKVVSKMRLKELNKALEKFKEKTPVKSHQVSSAAKRKGKEPMVAPSKKRRALIVEDEDDEEDITISAMALKNLSRSVPESMERQDKDTNETEQRTGERENLEAEERQTEEREAEEGDEEEERIEEEEERGDQAETEHEEYSSPTKGMETGGDRGKRGMSSYPATREGVSRSPADPEDIYASQFPGEGHDVSSPNLRDHADLLICYRLPLLHLIE